jgi:hypothetical protein
MESSSVLIYWQCYYILGLRLQLLVGGISGRLWPSGSAVSNLMMPGAQQAHLLISYNAVQGKHVTPVGTSR